MVKFKVTQTKSVIGGNQSQRETMRSLGLHKIGQSVVREDDAQNRGMLRVVDHLVTVEEVD